MHPQEPPSVTQLLTQWHEGDDAAGRELIAAVYKELRRLASVHLRHESNAATLQPTALVHELCVSMLSRPAVSCESRLHFLHLAAQQMRRLVVDHARKRGNQKRGGPQAALPLDEARDHAVPLDRRIEDIHEALGRLEQFDRRCAAVVEMRFFGGLTETEIGEILDISVATVKRDWEFARSWLLAQMDAA